MKSCPVSLLIFSQKDEGGNVEKHQVPNAGGLAGRHHKQPKVVAEIHVLMPSHEAPILPGSISGTLSSE